MALGEREKTARAAETFDRELLDLPPTARWREWMNRVEAVIFAAGEPVGMDVLQRLVGRDCSIELLIEDIREELRTRPYDIVRVAGGFQHRTRAAYADAIRAASRVDEAAAGLSPAQALVLMTIAYFQPLTRSELSAFIGREVSRDTIGQLRHAGFITSGPRSPQPGAPYTYITTDAFLSHFGFETLRDLPDIEKLEDAGLLDREKLLADIPGAVEAIEEEEDEAG
ncbi:SMC-Scp complex subunit ScpB [Mesorhizobium sp. RMAD-H1]|uniref:SMC-Scp complex subunit ScpB n=1 Tax=Mesorhizobium sp. RMAD-H1 TaxID=2587065 RepID=UPI00162070C6|nr:SMC-Scp complex subunit ScpB [Mesorhizobium sp. RMAD-H1]MBB2974405.1 segregation and condensation protein B [Mesorhizobium sp. RMAD-H1]